MDGIAALRTYLLSVLRRPSALASTTGLPRPSLVAPDTGGAQLIDATGALLDLGQGGAAGRSFGSLTVTASGGGVLSVAGTLRDGNGAAVQGIVSVYLDDSAGAAGVLTPAASVGTILPPAVIAVTRLAFAILTSPAGAFAYTATGTGAAGACTQIHASGPALNQQSVAIL